MEESQIGEAVEIRVEGDEPAVPIDSQSSQIAVGPKAMRNIMVAGKSHETGVNFRRILDEANPRLGAITSIDVPRLVVGQRAAEHLGMRAEPEKGERGDAAKGNFGQGLDLPVSDGSVVVRMVLVDQGQPDVDVGKIGHGLSPRPGAPAPRADCTSSSSKRA